MSEYKVIERRLDTRLSVKRCADVFRTHAPDISARRSRDSGFFTPQSVVTPFTAVEETEEPTYMVGWNSAQGHSVIIAVFDRGVDRRVEIESSYLTFLIRGRAEKTAQRLVTALSNEANASVPSDPLAPGAMAVNRAGESVGRIIDASTTCIELDGSVEGPDGEPIRMVFKSELDLDAMRRLGEPQGPIGRDVGCNAYHRDGRYLGVVVDASSSILRLDGSVEDGEGRPILEAFRSDLRGG